MINDDHQFNYRYSVYRKHFSIEVMKSFRRLKKIYVFTKTATKTKMKRRPANFLWVRNQMASPLLYAVNLNLLTLKIQMNLQKNCWAKYCSCTTKLPRKKWRFNHWSKVKKIYLIFYCLFWERYVTVHYFNEILHRNYVKLHVKKSVLLQLQSQQYGTNVCDQFAQI